MLYCAADGVSANPEQFVRWLRALLNGSGPTHGLLERLANPAALSNGCETDVGLNLAQS
jgi:hypothetical protein